MWKKSAIAGFVLMAVALTGCSRLPVVEDNKVLNHVISINRNGELNEITLSQPPEGSFKRVGQKQAAYLFGHILNGIRDYPANENNEIELLIYVHGGLNSKADSLGRALKNYECIASDGADAKYPVFINWETGPMQTYGAHLTRIRQGEVSNFARFTAPVYLLTDVANSVVNASKSWLITGEHSWRSTVFRHRKGVDAHLQQYKSGANGVLYTGNGHADGLVRRAQWLVTSPAKFASTPFTYTMAKPAWDVMLRRSNTLFFRDQDLDGGQNPLAASNSPGTGALSLFLKALDKMIGQEKKKGRNIKITLAGHSMGAIIVNRMLTTDYEHLKVSNIVHMASADSIRNLFNTVVPYLQRNKEARFFSLSLHPENEDREANYLGAVPSGSLLVWIDNMFTTPETVLDKRSGRWANMERVLPKLPAQLRPRMRFKIYGLQTRQIDRCGMKKMTQALQHGDFDELEYWKESTWWQ